MKTREGGTNLGVLQSPAAELCGRERTEIEESETLGDVSALPLNCWRCRSGHSSPQDFPDLKDGYDDICPASFWGAREDLVRLGMEMKHLRELWRYYCC